MNKIQIHDAITNEVIVRDMTDDEIKEFNKFQTEAKKQENEQAKVETAKQAARQAVLDKLGLTADEAAALLG